MIATHQLTQEPELSTSRRVEESLLNLRRGNVQHGTMFSIVTAVAILSVLIVLAISLDWYFGWLSSVTRWCITLVAWLATLGTLIAMVASVWQTRRLNDELAQQADVAAPAFEERLQTIVSVQSDRFSVDRQMMEQVFSETESIYEGVDPSEFVERRRLRIPLGVIATCGLLLMGMFAVESRSARILMTRFLWPSTTSTRTVIEGDMGSQVIGRGEPWALSGTLQGPTLNTVALEQRMSPNETVHRTIDVSGENANAVHFSLSRTKQSFDYRITAGDFRGDWTMVTVANRPRIIGAELHIIPPKYTGHKPTHLSKIPTKLNVLKGSNVVLAIRTEGDVDRAEWMLTPDQGTRSMYAEEGNLLCNIRIDQSVGLSPRLVEPNGLENRDRFAINIRALDDRPPSVKITKPSPDAAVRPDDTVRIEFEATDDIGIKRANVVVFKTDQLTGEVTELKKLAVPIDPNKNQRRVRSGADINLSELDLEHGETISYRVDVYDQKQLGVSDNSASESTNESDQANQPSSDSADQNSSEAKDKEASESTDKNSNSSRDSATSKQAQQPSADASAEQGAAETVKAANKSQPNSSAESMPSKSDKSNGDTSSEQSDSQAKNAVSESQANDDAESMPSKSNNKSANEQRSESSDSKSSNATKDADDSGDEDSGEDSNDDSSDQGEMKVDASAANSLPRDPESTNPDPSDATSSDSDSSDAASDKDAGDNPNADENTDQKAASEIQPNSDDQEMEDDEKNMPSSGDNNKSSSQSQNKSQTSQSSARNSSKPSESKPAKQQTPDAGRGPTMRELDAVKPSSSPQMELKIDKYAGSFQGQARRKLEIAIEPILKNLKKWLTSTEQLLGSVQFNASTSPEWNEGKQQSLSRAITYLDQSTDGIDELVSRTNETPYAFVGLQISDIALTHLDPAYSDASAALKATDSRYSLIDNSRIQVQRALARLDELTEKFEREKREQLLADKIAEYERVYRIYIEDTLAKLQAQRDRINSIKREGVEFDLDEEYLQRLQEILEMRRELEAELARILAEDPRLLKRFSQSSRDNADSLRDQFTVLARRQATLTQIGLKITADDNSSDGIEMRTLEVAYRLTRRLGDFADRFDTWMPLNEIKPTPEITKAIEGFREASSRGERLRQSVLQQAQKLGDAAADYAQCTKTADTFIAALGDLRQQLIAMGVNTTNDEVTANAVNRLNEISRLRDSMMGWRFQINAIAEGRKSEALAVDQHRLMTELHEYTDKMSTLPQQVARLLPDPNAMPANIADLSQQLLSKIDTGIEPTQLAAVLALRKEDHAKARQRMASAVQQFNQAEEIFDQLMIAIVKVLDELPVNDPITSLLNDPTLEQILANLERETPLNELLGIPNRPSNLRIISDWKNRNGSNGSGSGGSGGSSVAEMLKKMMQAEQKKKQQGLKTLKEKLRKATPEDDLDEGASDGRSRWSKVISELQDGLIQQRGGGVPEHYRSAIQQYFETISSK